MASSPRPVASVLLLFILDKALLIMDVEFYLASKERIEFKLFKNAVLDHYGSKLINTPSITVPLCKRSEG